MGSFLAQRAFLGDKEVLVGNSFLGQEQVVFNPFYETTAAFRNDPFSSSLFLAMPGSQFTSLGMTSFYDDVSAAIRGTGNKISLVPTGSGAYWASGSIVLNYSGSNWADQGYTTAMAIGGAQNLGALAWTMCTGSNGIGMGTSSFVIEGFISRRGNYGNPPFQLHIFGQAASDSLLTQWSATALNFYLDGNPLQWGVSSTLGTYYHLAFVRSGNNTYIYVNGTRVNSGTFIGDFDSEGFAAILGNNSVNDGVYKGVQDFRIYIGTDKNYTGSVITVPQSIVVLQ